MWKAFSSMPISNASSGSADLKMMRNKHSGETQSSNVQTPVVLQILTLTLGAYVIASVICVVSNTTVVFIMQTTTSSETNLF